MLNPFQLPTLQRFAMDRHLASDWFTRHDLGLPDCQSEQLVLTVDPSRA
jgi:hypothetical protein